MWDYCRSYLFFRKDNQSLDKYVFISYSLSIFWNETHKTLRHSLNWVISICAVFSYQSSLILSFQNHTRHSPPINLYLPTASKAKLSSQHPNKSMKRWYLKRNPYQIRKPKLSMLLSYQRIPNYHENLITKGLNSISRFIDTHNIL